MAASPTFGSTTAVTGNDYSLIDFAYTHPNTLNGWQNGDYNYDGKVDGSDYTRKMLDYVCGNRQLFDPSHSYTLFNAQPPLRGLGPGVGFSCRGGEVCQQPGGPNEQRQPEKDGWCALDFRDGHGVEHSLS